MRFNYRQGNLARIGDPAIQRRICQLQDKLGSLNTQLDKANTDQFRTLSAQAGKHERELHTLLEYVGQTNLLTT
jgi:hypothetical protein